MAKPRKVLQEQVKGCRRAVDRFAKLWTQKANEIDQLIKRWVAAVGEELHKFVCSVSSQMIQSMLGWPVAFRGLNWLTYETPLFLMIAESSSRSKEQPRSSPCRTLVTNTETRCPWDPLLMSASQRFDDTDFLLFTVINASRSGALMRKPSTEYPQSTRCSLISWVIEISCDHRHSVRRVCSSSSSQPLSGLSLGNKLTLGKCLLSRSRISSFPTLSETITNRCDRSFCRCWRRKHSKECNTSTCEGKRKWGSQ